MNNFRKHQEWVAKTWPIDWYSSVISFSGWAEYDQVAEDDPEYGLMWRVPPTYNPLLVYLRKSWLLSEGWRLAGKISCCEILSVMRS